MLFYILIFILLDLLLKKRALTVEALLSIQLRQKILFHHQFLGYRRVACCYSVKVYTSIET